MPTAKKIKCEVLRRISDEQGNLKDKGDVVELNTAAAKKLQNSGAVRVLIDD